jgi:hypothetical protein
MKWMKAKSEKICTPCGIVIDEGERYFGGSYQTFCHSCGIKYRDGDLRYSPKDKGYIDTVTQKKCSICGEHAENTIHGRTVCDNCVGEVMPNEI